MIRRILCFLVFMLLCSIVWADWQWWNEFETNFEPIDKVEVYATAEQKFQNDMSDIYCYNFAIGGVYMFNKYLEVDLSYLFEREREYICDDTWDDWLDENRIRFGPIIVWEMIGLKFNDRNRFEYRDLQDRENKWRYRNRLMAKKDILIKDFVFTAFMSDELFFDLEGEGLNKNRFAIGVAKEITDFLEFELFYLLESCKSDSSWNHDTNVLGTVFVLSF